MHDAALVVFRCLDKAALVVSLLFVDVAYAEEVNLRCPWSSGGAAYADLVVVDLTARTLQRTVVDAGGNAIQTLPALKAEISDSEITATYNDTVYKLNRYTAALSSQFPSGAHTVLQCETYEKGAKKF